MPGSPASCSHPADSPDAEDTAPPCPICLTHIDDERDRAVVLDCLHVFCVPCISRWAKLRRECPLCKGFFKASSLILQFIAAEPLLLAYIHDIVSATDFKERRLSPLRTVNSKETDGSEDAIQALLRDAREQYNIWQHSQPRHSGGGTHQRQRRGHHSSSAHRSSNPERQGLTEPRPYYFRLQRNLAARAVSEAYGQAAVPAAAPDQTLDWRRSIYSRNVWALPVRVAGISGNGCASAAGTLPPNAAAPAGEQRLQDWVARELQALLQQEDVLIVKGLVLSLVRSHGLASPPRHSSGVSGSSPRSVRPADALRPFLHEAAQHFWHELRNFAAAPFTIITYDRTVRYGSPEQAAGSRQAPADAATRPVSEERRRRWDVQPVRHARPSTGSRSRWTAAAAPQHERAQRRSTEQEPAQPRSAEPATRTAEAEPDRHRDQGGSSSSSGGGGAAQSAAELSALRSRALQALRGRSSPEAAGQQCREKQRSSLCRSPSPAKQRRQRHRSRRASPSEPQHRKRQARRHVQRLEGNDSSRRQPVAAEVSGIDDERWVMD